MDKTGEKTTGAGRDERLAEALRANLKRRKAQARRRKAVAEPPANSNRAPKAH